MDERTKFGLALGDKAIVQAGGRLNRWMLETEHLISTRRGSTGTVDAELVADTVSNGGAECCPPYKRARDAVGVGRMDTSHYSRRVEFIADL
jgi:hypothetical protein